jgi:ribosomal protein S27E
MIKRVLLGILALGTSILAEYMLYMLDLIVHGSLYNYGLQFSLDWANPYWTLLRITQSLLAICGITSAVITLLSVRALKAKPAIMGSARNRATKKLPLATKSTEASLDNSNPPSESLTGTAPEQMSRTDSGLIKCVNCGKMLFQPLRMLDYHGEQPRIVNVCPFCSKTIPSTSGTQQRKNGKTVKFFFRKGDNHMERTSAR